MLTKLKIKGWSSKKTSIIERDFDEAIKRLALGTPDNPDLKLLSAKGKLRVNLSTVAREAGRARTLIALKDCRFPGIRAKVLSFANSASSSSSSMAVLQKLRQEIKSLKDNLQKSQALQLVAFYEKEDAVKEARRWRDAYQRLKRSISESSKVVTLTPVRPEKALDHMNHE